MSAIRSPRIHSEAAHVEGKCIWCLGVATSRDLEHVIPEAMGGPWVLPGTVVCLSCNQRLAHLDRAVCDPFDFLTCISGIRGKKGRIGRASSRGNAIAEAEGTGLTIRFNEGKNPVVLQGGKVLSGRGSSPRNVSSSVQSLPDGMTSIELSVPMVFDRAATRGLVKIGFEAHAWMLGSHFALGEQFDTVRRFVLNDVGDRRVMMLKSDDLQYRHEISPLCLGPNLEPLIRFRLAVVDFLVDLTPDCRFLNQLETAHRMYGSEGWHIVPNVN